MKTIVTVSLAAAFAAAGLAAAAPADAAYKAKVGGGTLTITGNGAGDKLALRLQKGNRNVLVVDVKANGSADFSFDRSTFKRIVVNAGGGNDTVSVIEKNGACDQSIVWFPPPRSGCRPRRRRLSQWFESPPRGRCRFAEPPLQREGGESGQAGLA